MTIPSFDVFKFDGRGVLWCCAVDNLLAGKQRIQKLAASSPGEYFILDQITDQRVFVTLLDVFDPLPASQPILNPVMTVVAVP